MTKSKNLGNIVKTADGSLTLRNPDIDEEYHSTAGAAFESRELYIERSGFKKAIKSCQKVQVLDVGLGLGYNALVTIESWFQSDIKCDLDLVSLELNENLVSYLSSGVAPWQQGWSRTWLDLSQQLTKQDDGLWLATWKSESGAILRWTVLVGDASKLELEGWQFNYIWQDAFSPKKNVELWSDKWFTKLSKASHKNVVLMTYSVARVVKDGLEGGGWAYERIEAPGKKRHWLRASLSTT